MISFAISIALGVWLGVTAAAVTAWEIDRLMHPDSYPQSADFYCEGDQ